MDLFHATWCQVCNAGIAMSDNTQAHQRRYKSSKAIEGRLKLSTSCTECHRRKQKCDQERPVCRNCSRRFPPVECRYRTLKSSKATDTSESLEDALRTRTPTALTLRNASSSGSFPRIAVQRPDDYQSIVSYYKTIGSLIDGEAWSYSLDGKKLEQDSPSAYQQLLTIMVSNISTEMDGDESKVEGTSKASVMIKEGNFVASDRELLAKGHFVTRDQQAMLQSPDIVPAPSKFSISMADPLHYLGVKPTAQSGELLQAFVKLITKYMMSIDGRPAPNYYNDYWVPWSIKSPLLANLGIFTASCYQAEALKIPPHKSAVVLKYKCDALSQINAMLSNKDTATSNEVIAGVNMLIINEWYWSGHEVIHAHMNGLKEIVRLRGGLGELGMNGFIRMIILTTDYQIAISYRHEPMFPHNVSPVGRFPVYMNTPLVQSRIDFASNTTELGISPETAAILDDMKFLLRDVSHHVNREMSESDNDRLTATSIFIKDRIFALPSGTGPSDPLAGDHIYKSCRIAALIYCKAIVERMSLSDACTLWDLNYLWANMWKVRLMRWKQIPGIFLFIILAAISAAQDTAHGRFLKSMFKTTTIYIAHKNWDVADNCLMAHVRLSRWLRPSVREHVMSPVPEPLAFVHMYECY